MSAFKSENRLWLFTVALILDGFSQSIVQRWQTPATRLPVTINVSANETIFDHSCQKIDCGLVILPNSVLLLKSQIVHGSHSRTFENKEYLSMATLGIDKNNSSQIVFGKKHINNHNADFSKHQVWQFCSLTQSLGWNELLRRICAFITIPYLLPSDLQSIERRQIPSDGHVTSALEKIGIYAEVFMRKNLNFAWTRSRTLSSQR